MSEKFLPNCHDSELDKMYYNDVENGNKIYECRINDKKRKNMKIGDHWKFSLKGDKNMCFETIIIDKKEYISFEAAIKDTCLNQLLPNIITQDEAVKIYKEFPGYEENSKIYGVVVFKLQTV